MDIFFRITSTSMGQTAIAVPHLLRLRAFENLMGCAETNENKAMIALKKGRYRLFKYYLEVAEFCRRDALSLRHLSPETHGDRPDRDSVGSEMTFSLANSVLPKMEDARGEDGIGLPGIQNIHHMIKIPSAPAGDDGNADG